jgi:serine/threonine protein phosphatase PrpC
MSWQSRAHSHPGLRPRNEDSWLQAPDLGLWAVADGMGGHADGDLASRTATAALERAVSHGAGLAEAVAAASAAVWQAARQRDSDMGTTLAALRVTDGQGQAAWLGDSRIYRFRDGELHQLSRDHSRVQELVEAGLVHPDRARDHPERPVLTAAAGLEPDAWPEATPVNPLPGDIFLLCSDGLSDVVDEAEMAAVMANTPAAEIPAALTRAALEHQQPHQDNTTVVVAWHTNSPRKGKP